MNKIYKTSFFGYFILLTILLLKKGDGGLELKLFTNIIGEVNFLDKIIHFITFFILTILFKMAYPQYKGVYLTVILISYALLIELLQHIMPYGRNAELLDLGADFIGILIANITFKKYLSSKIL